MIKITNNNLPLSPQPKVAAKTGEAAQVNAFKSTVSKKYDELIIDRKSETQAFETQASSAAKAKVMKDISDTGDKARIEEIKAQVAAGTYKPDVEEAVRKMMMGVR